MQPVYSKNRVLENREVSNGIYELTVEGKFEAKPGQFYMVRAWGMEPLLSRPISVHDLKEGSISFLYEIKGKGTKILSELSEGDSIELTGPSGNGFDTEHIKGKIAVVTGGIGIAPMLYTVKELKESKIDLYAGFRDDVYGVDNFKPYVDNIYISTDSGSKGHKGFITEIFSPWDYSVVLCCGPEVMMDMVVRRCMECATPVFISAESCMACGIGACLVCTCKTNKGNKRVCKDGPVFWGREVCINA